MALNSNLNLVLSNIVDNVAPVIKLPSGLYTIVDKQSITPDENLGTNLLGQYRIGWSFYNYKIIGNWNDTDHHYEYDSNTNTWTYNQIM